MSVPDQNPQAQQDSKEQQLERNFANQRKHYEKQIEAQRQEFEQRLAQIEQERQAKHKDVDDDDDVSDEPYIDKKALKKTLAKEREELRKEFKTAVQQEARGILEQEKQASFLEQNPDFQEVLTPENIQKYAEKHPAMAKAMLKMPDSFERQQLLYENIKALGVNKPPAPPQPSMQEILKNNRKPLYYQPTSVGAAPYANNGDFSQEGQKAAYAKMKDLLNNRKAL